MNNDLEILYNILTQNDVVLSIKENIDELVRIIPEVRTMFNFDQKNPHHHLDVWEHTLLALSFSDPDFEIRLILLLHDIGKPLTAFDDESGVRHFWGHPYASGFIAEKIFNRLNIPNDLKSEMLEIIERHDDKMSPIYIKINKERALKLFEVQRCDSLAHDPKKVESRIKYLNHIKSLFI